MLRLQPVVYTHGKMSGYRILECTRVQAPLRGVKVQAGLDSYVPTPHYDGDHGK